MPEVEIVKRQVVTIAEVWENDDKDLMFSDEKGDEYKVRAKRTQYFEMIEPGATVQLNWAKFKGHDYIYSAEKVEANAKSQLPKSEVKAEPKPVTVEQAKEVVKTSSRSMATDDRIAEQVSVKAGIELWTMGMIKADDPLAKACYQWCCDKLSHYLTPTLSEHQPSHDKPLETQPSASQTDKDILLGLVMNKMGYNLKTAESWLTKAQKIPQERIDKEPKAVAKELMEKMEWT